MANSPTVMRRRLGMKLRDLREQAGKNQGEAGQVIEMTPQGLSRIELGRGGIKQRDLKALLDFYGVKPDDPERADLEEMARNGRKRGWWSVYNSVIDSGYATFVGFEDAATEVSEYAALVMPGLLQTESYARAVITAARPDLPVDTIERRVKLRMERQDRLTDGLRFWAVLDEAVIRRVAGGPDVMREELQHLVELSRLQTVTIQVVPYGAGAYPGMVSAFTLLSFDGDPDVVYIEGHSGDQFLEGEATRQYTLHLNGLRAAGLNPNESIRMIEDAAKALR